MRKSPRYYLYFLNEEVTEQLGAGPWMVRQFNSIEILPEFRGKAEKTRAICI